MQKRGRARIFFFFGGGSSAFCVPTPAALSFDCVDLLNDRGELVVVVASGSPPLRKLWCITPVVFVLVRSTAQLQRHGPSRGVHCLGQVLVPGRIVALSTVIHLYVIDTPLCKRVCVLFEVPQAAWGPPAVAGNVANRGVESKLDPEVMQVVDDRHHAVWEKSCEWHEFLY